MAFEPLTTVSAHKPIETASGSPPGPLVATDLPLFRFGTRQLLWFVALVSALLACIVSLQGLTALALLLAALVVIAHLFSTALGSRLRSLSDHEQASRAEHAGGGAGQPENGSGSVSAGTGASTARSPWHDRGSTSLPWLPRLIVAGVIVGGAGGTLLLAATIGHDISAAGILVGAVSLAVLGGWFAFLGGSFYGIFRHGIRDALADQRKDESHHAAQR